MSQEIEDKIINHLVAKYFLRDVFDKILSEYEKGKGVCIGNMVSQIVATFYLDEIDKYIQEKLEIKAYARYMDDFYCMHESKEYLKNA